MRKIVAAKRAGRAGFSGHVPMPLWLLALPPAMLLSACGGGTDSTSSAPILQVGMQRQYVGTVMRSVTYTHPSGDVPTSTLTYTFVENQSVRAAASSDQADYDVHSDYTYTVTADPGIGTVPITQSVDSYENLLTSGNSQTTQTVAQNTTLVSNDESSDALGGGPYNETTTSSASFPTARSSFSYPLQNGATMNVPQSAISSIAFTDVNADGTSPPNGSNIGYSRTRIENDDGSFSYQTTYVNGNSGNLTQNADGSGSYVFTSPTANTMTTLALPTSSSGSSSLPVVRSSTPSATGVTTSTDYAAADWYPNNGAPNTPLVLQAEAVVGAVSTLPAGCQGAVLRPDIYEIDTTTTNEATINASFSMTTTQSFNADGVTVCSLSQATSYAYDLLTGELTSTTTTTTTTTLNSINY